MLLLQTPTLCLGFENGRVQIMRSGATASTSRSIQRSTCRFGDGASKVMPMTSPCFWIRSCVSTEDQKSLGTSWYTLVSSKKFRYTEAMHWSQVGSERLGSHALSWLQAEGHGRICCTKAQKSNAPWTLAWPRLPLQACRTKEQPLPTARPAHTQRFTSREAHWMIRPCA